MKKIVLAFDSFKGCMTAAEACSAAADGIRSVLPETEVVEMPISDGGEGMVNCVRANINVTGRQLTVHGPMMEPVVAEYIVSEDGPTAYMEMAAASGLTLVDKDKRNPMIATTYGVGEMIAHAISQGCKRIMMGIGGSATCDGGQGMISALRDLNCTTGDCHFVVACDVANPLFGPNGAACVYAPQKGANEVQVAELDDRLRQFAYQTEQAGIATPDMAQRHGAGAAGGLGYAMMAYLNAELRSGIETMLDIVGFDSIAQGADLVITGEGKSDRQTLEGKAAYGISHRCRRMNVPVWLLSGAIEDESCALADNFDLVKSINQGDSRPLEILLQRETAMANMKRTIESLV